MNAVDIISNLETFTEEEKARIDQLACNAVENITYDDMQLFARWQTSMELANERFAQEQAALKSVIDAKIENDKRISEASIELLKARTDLARAKLKAVENGQV